MSKLNRFLETLADYGECYFSTGDKRMDIRDIERVIAHQGYWAGNNLRFYFDEKFNLLRTEQRVFGMEAS